MHDLFVEVDDPVAAQPVPASSRLYVDAGAQTLTFALRPPIDWDAVHSFVEDVTPAFRSEKGEV
jgi:hypothetical protein